MSKKAIAIMAYWALAIIVVCAYKLGHTDGYRQGERSVQVTMQVRAPEPPDFEWTHAACFGDYGQKLYIHDISFEQKDDGTLDIGPISMKDYKLLESIGK